MSAARIPVLVELAVISNPNSGADGYVVELADLADSIAKEWRRNSHIRLEIKRMSLTAKEWKEIKRNAPEREGW